MAAIRKIKGSLVKQDITEYIGEYSYIFYDIETGHLRLYDGTPGGKAIPSGGIADNYTATTDPTVDNDSTELYEVGSHWINIATDMIFSCVDSTEGAAVWLNITAGQYLNQTGLTGEGSGLVSPNADPTLVDIAPATYFIQGQLKLYPGVVAYDPAFGVGENSVFLGIDIAGTIVHQVPKWSSEDTRTIIPLARLNTEPGQTGPGSVVEQYRDDRYYIDESGYRDRLWHERVVGVLYQTGGIIGVNGTVPLQIDQTAGILFDAQRKEQILAQQENIDALALFHTGGFIATEARSPLVVDTGNYDNGTDLVAIPSNKWINHTLLKSPKGAPQEGDFFFVYGKIVHDSQAAAEGQAPDYSFFGSQSISGMIAVAQFIVNEGDAFITTVTDNRPRWIGTSGGFISTGVTDHGELFGIADDDHLQYHTEARAETWLTAKQVTVAGSPSPGQDQLIFALPDAVRLKTLSVDTEVYQFNETVVAPDAYIGIGSAGDPLTGIIMPLDGTIIRVTGHCSDTGGNAKDIDLYLNGDATATATLGTITGPGEQTFADNLLNIDVSAGDKIRLRGSNDAGTIQDTNITLYIKWRA